MTLDDLYASGLEVCEPRKPLVSNNGIAFKIVVEGLRLTKYGPESKHTLFGWQQTMI